MSEIVLAAACASLGVSTAEAQRSPLSFETSVGAGIGRSNGEHRGAPSFTADALVGLQLRQTTVGSLVTGVSANMYLAGPYTDDCVLATNGVDCLSSLPSFQAIAVLAGWENTSGTLRAMVGPAYVRDLENDASTVGLQGRADAALRLAGPFDFVLSVRGTLIPSLHSNAFQFLALGAGLRLR